MRLAAQRKTLPQSNGEAFYDIVDDWNLIESSFFKQYGIRLRNSGEDDLSWLEFLSLLGGIMQDTPLGQVVAIRAEKDPKVIKNFTPDQKRIRNEWNKRKFAKMKQDKDAYRQYWQNMQAQLKMLSNIESR